MKKRTGLFLLAAFALVGCSSYGNEISAEEFAVRKQNIQNEDADVADLNGYTYTLELKDPTENFYSKVEAKYVKSTNDLMLKTFVKSNDTCEGAAIYSVTKGDTYTFVTASLDEKENVDKGTYFQIKSPLVSTIASHISDIKNTINSYVGSLKSDYVSIEKLDQAIENPQLFFEFENNNFETSIKYYSKNQKSLAVVY